MGKLVDIIGSSLFFSEATQERKDVLEKYYIEGMSVKSLLEEGISGWLLQRTLNVKTQLPVFLTDIFNGLYDDVLDDVDFDRFLNRLIFLFGYADKFNMFRKNVKLKKMIFSLRGKGLSFAEIVKLCGFIFYNSSTPIIITQLESKNFDESFSGIIDDYNVFVNKLIDIKILKKLTCTECGNYYGVSCYDSMKNNLVPFIVHLISLNIDRVDSEKFNIFNNFILGISFKIMSCSFKFKKFKEQSYLINMFNPYTKYIEHDVCAETIKNMVGKIQPYVQCSDIDTINRRKIDFKNFPFKK